MNGDVLRPLVGLERVPSTVHPSTFGIRTSSVITSGCILIARVSRPLVAVLGHCHAVPLLRQRPGHQVAGWTGSSSTTRTSGPSDSARVADSPGAVSAAFRRGIVIRNVEPSPGDARHGHVAAQHPGEAPRDREAQAGAAVLAGRRGVGLGERLEKLGDLFLRHADARVRHGDLDPRLPFPGVVPRRGGRSEGHRRRPR